MKRLSLLLLLLFSIFCIKAQTIQLDIKVFLEGPFSSGQMNNELNSLGLIPISHPFDTVPWSYYGSEKITTLHSDAVDWVLVEMMKKSPDTSSHFFDVKRRKSGLLLRDGSIRGLDGTSLLEMDSIMPSFYLRIIHRNHIPLISNQPLTHSSGIYAWDFSASQNKTLDTINMLTEVQPGTWAMIAGDGNTNQQINNLDKNDFWLTEYGETGYLLNDYNLDGSVTEMDKDIYWNPNAGRGTMDIQFESVLSVCTENGRYFCQGDKAVFLTGSHTWDTFQDLGLAFNYEDYIQWVVDLDHNYIKFWMWETEKGTDWAKITDLDISPSAYKKVEDKFDVTQLDSTFFDRLQYRIQLAEDHDLYTTIMLFQGFSADHGPIAWGYHPFNDTNNINGISADRFEVHTHNNPDVVEAQHLYVKKVIDVVNQNGFNKVLYEIGNEIEYTPESEIWHNDMIDFIHDYEFQTYGVCRPVGKTFQWYYGSNDYLFNSPADWVSPNKEGGWDCRDGDAPIALGDKVIISDTDHYYYQYYNANGFPIDMVWKSFTGGINVCHMDNWGGGDNLPGRLHGWPSANSYIIIRNNMGYARLLSETLNLIPMIPQPGISSTGFCMGSEEELVVYFPELISTAMVDLSLLTGQYSVEWLNCTNGSIIMDTVITAGSSLAFNSPYSGYAVLILRKLN
jgi:hypothetical protein